MEEALSYLGEEAESFAYPSVPGVTYRRVALRRGELVLDNGLCRETVSLAFFDGRAPSRSADCKPNEVEVPRVVGERLADAKARLEAQPLTPELIYKPAAPRQRVDVVVGQFPQRGTLSSYDTVTLVLAKPLHGTVPRVVGEQVAAARARLRARKLRPVVRVVPAERRERPGTVIEQTPDPGVAAAPNMPVMLVVAR
jgi:hypothetical protein